MQYVGTYLSPIGRVLLACDEAGLTGLWFEGAKYYARGLEATRQELEHPYIKAARKWLDLYFSGQRPDFALPIHMLGTVFQKNVWEILSTIPYGEVITYGEIARLIACKQGVGRMSAQAVGGAVGHNPISIIIPCHRVVGTNGSLTGYAGGIDKKVWLLNHEKADMEKYFIPTKGTAL